MMPKQCSTIFDLLYDVIGVAVYDLVGDIVLSTIIDPVRVKTGRAVVNGKHGIGHNSLDSPHSPSMFNCNPGIALGAPPS